MEEISLFSEWLEQEVQNDLQQGMVVPEDVEDSSSLKTFPRSPQIQKYVCIWLPLSSEECGAKHKKYL